MMNLDDEERFDLNELKLGFNGKLLFAAIGAWVLGKAFEGVKLKGTREQVDAVQRAMVATKRFHEELNNPVATLDTVSVALEEKHESALEFEQKTGVPWLL